MILAEGLIKELKTKVSVAPKEVHESISVEEEKAEKALTEETEERKVV